MKKPNTKVNRGSAGATSAVDDEAQLQEALVQKIRAQLDAEAGSLDGATQARLNQARLAASAGLQPRANILHRWYWSAGSVAACLLLVVVALQYAPTLAPRAPGSAAMPSGAELAVIEDALLHSVDTGAGANDAKALAELEAVAMLAALGEQDSLDFYAELGFLEWLDQQEDAAHLLDPEYDAGNPVQTGSELG